MEIFCLGMPQQYDDDYGDYENAEGGETAAYEEEEPNINAPAVQTVFKYKSQTLTVTEGENVDLSCETQTPNDDVIIFKKLNGTGSKDQILYVGEMKVERRTNFINDHSVFKLTNIKRTDGGTYICYYQDNSDTELRFELDVQYPPTVKAKTPLKQRVEKGDSVTVECEANGNPKPTIKWSKESGRLPSGNQEEMGYSMTLENVDRHVEGTYICTADNGIGEPASTSMKLTVEYPPEITTEKAIVRTGEGDKVELVCIVHSRPLAEVLLVKEWSSSYS
ncbi:Lachesin [Armadillidium nasatum]|uniref:Lachesin n=1 Tax=Armadillidium nasatum TaxID=96803 RepID=A0A5N5T8D1_9CRUS|nr:Lachesin [Armadillidium nasatum]